MPVLWPRLRKWLQVENLKPIATPEPASSVTSQDLGGAAGKGGKGKGAEGTDYGFGDVGRKKKIQRGNDSSCEW